MRGRSSLNLGSLSGSTLGDDVAANPGPATVSTNVEQDKADSILKVGAVQVGVVGLAVAVGMAYIVYDSWKYDRSRRHGWK